MVRPISHAELGPEATQTPTNRSQKPNMSYIDFSNLFHDLNRVATDPSGAKLLNPQTAYQIARSLVSLLTDSEQKRLNTLYTILEQNVETNNGHDLPLILKAIQEQNLALLEQSNKINPETLPLNFLQHEGNLQGLVTNLLLESVRSSFLDGVKYFLKNYPYEDLIPYEKIYSYSLDPLSLAIITYATLPEDHPDKTAALEIIYFLAENKGIQVDKSFETLITWSPTTWSSLFGLLDITKFLHEQKQTELVETLQLGLEDTEQGKIQLRDFIASQGFLYLLQYYEKEEGQTLQHNSSCKNIFLH